MKKTRKTRMASQRQSDEIAEKIKESQENNQQKSNDDASSPLAPPSTSQDNPSEDKAAPSAASPQRSPSPEPNCSICLGNLENKSFTDSCFHQFCFVCLLEWSKVKAECPLCKQPFKSIIHNVRSFEDYDQYHLRPNVAEERARERFRFRTTMTGESWMVRQRQRQREHERAQLLRPSRTTAHTLWRGGRQAATSEFRRRIYQRNMRVEQEQTNTGRRTMRFRNVSPKFFSGNPACSHRLVPWLNRELNVLLRNDANHVQFVLDLILGLIKRFDIQSEEFRQHLVSLLHRRTDHFIHEFYNFARSPYDLISYDQHAVYIDPRDADVHELSSDSNSDRDDILPNTYNNDVVDLVNTTTGAAVDPVVIDNSVVVLDSDDEEVRPSTSGLSLDAPVDLSNAAMSRNLPSTSLQNVPTAGIYNELLVDYAGTASVGWDNPLRGTSNLFNVRTFLSSISNMFTNIYGPSTSTGGTTVPRPRQRRRSRSSAETIDSDVDSIASSRSSDLMVTGVEKPWNERSPIPLSTDEEANNDTKRKLLPKKKSKKKSDRGDSKKKDRQHSKDKHKKETEGSSSEHRKEKGKSHKHSKSDNKERRRREREERRDERRVEREERRVEREDRRDEREERREEGREERRRRVRALTISSENSDVILHAVPRKGTSERSDCVPYSERAGRYRAPEDLFAAVRNWMDDIPPIDANSRSSQHTSRSRSQSSDRVVRDHSKTSRSHDVSSVKRDRSSKSQHSSLKSRDTSSRSHERYSSQRDRRSRSNERRSTSRDRSSRPRERYPQSHDGLSKSRDRHCDKSPSIKSSKSRIKHSPSNKLSTPDDKGTISSHTSSNEQSDKTSRSKDRRPSSDELYAHFLNQLGSPKGKRKRDFGDEDQYQSKSKHSRLETRASESEFSHGSLKSATGAVAETCESENSDYKSGTIERTLEGGKRSRSKGEKCPREIQDGEVTSSNRAACSHAEESGKDANSDDTEAYDASELHCSNSHENHDGSERLSSNSHENHDAPKQNSEHSPKRTHSCDSNSDTELRVEPSDRISSEQNCDGKLSKEVDSEANCDENVQNHVFSESDRDECATKEKQPKNDSDNKSGGEKQPSSTPTGRDLIKFKIFKKNPTGHKKSTLKTIE